MIAIAREFILSRYQLCASKYDLQHGNNSIIIFFWNIDFLYFFQHLEYFFVKISIIFCQHLDHLHFFPDRWSSGGVPLWHHHPAHPCLLQEQRSKPFWRWGLSFKQKKEVLYNVSQANLPKSWKNLESLKLQKWNLSKSGWNSGGCRQRVVLSGRLTDTPPGRCQRVNTPINPDKVWQITSVMASQGCFCFTTSHKHAP